MDLPRGREWTGSGACRTLVEQAVRKLETRRVRARLQDRDHTLWKPSPVEISNRLGWLDSPRTMPAEAGRIRRAACSPAVLPGASEPLRVGFATGDPIGSW